jgi:hypothetical protein
LSPFGVKYDREIVIVDADDLKHVTTNNYKTMACLFQQLVEGQKVTIKSTKPERLTKLGLPTELTLPLEIDPTKIGPFF